MERRGTNSRKDAALLREMLVDARKSVSLTQSELAHILKKPQSYISKYESGERRLDVVEFLQVLEALKSDPAKFIAEFIRRSKLRGK